MGIALHNYHDVYRLFPPGMRFKPSSSTDAIGTANVSLLPFLEQANLQNVIDPTIPWYLLQPNIVQQNAEIIQQKEEIEALQSFMPKALSNQEIDQLVVDALAESGAKSMQDMGKVMGWLKPKVTGRADMGALSGSIKAKLA